MSLITMSQFGQWGRAGNQFFQYCFLRLYAKKHNLELQIPPWVGTHLFGLKDSPVSKVLPPWKEPGSGLDHPTPPQGTEAVNRDFQGYAQYHTSYYAKHQKEIRSFFQPVPRVRARVAPARARLHMGRGTTIGLHIRRGDYGRGIFPLVPIPWYLDWLRDNWGKYYKPRLFIATEDPSVVENFRDYDPQTIETLGIDLKAEPMADCTYLTHDLETKDNRALDWYPDFYLLSTCDVILGGSSTFSFFAAMLNSSLQEYWRATLADAEFVLANPWNAFPILREHVRDYPHLEGIALERNPYW